MAGEQKGDGLGHRFTEELLENTLLALSRLPDRVRVIEKDVGELEERVKANSERLEALDRELDAAEERLEKKISLEEEARQSAVKVRQEWTRAITIALLGIVGTIVAGVSIAVIVYILKTTGVIG